MHLNPKESPRLDRVSVSPHFLLLLPRGVDLRRFYLHESVVIKVSTVLLAGVLSQFCIFLGGREVQIPVPIFHELQHLSRCCIE